MSLGVKDFAKATADSIQRDGTDESDVEIFEASESSGSRRKTGNMSQLPKIEGKRLLQGPLGSDGNIRVKYEGMIDGFRVDTDELTQMESIGLPTGFSFGAPRDKTKKGDKKTFYCDTCLIELNSEDTMMSHVRGTKHMKKTVTKEQEAEDRGERRPVNPIRPIPNPESSKKKIPIRLQEKIRESRDPVIGLEYVKEVLAESDAEMDPYYECELCGSKGIANGMFSHIMGHKHRQSFIKAKHPGEDRYEELSQKACLQYAAKHCENDSKLSELIRTTQDDVAYPWPPGKAPWAVEQGGTGIPPREAKENFGLTKVEWEPKHRPAAPGNTGTLPPPERLKKPRSKEEADRYFILGERLITLASDGLSAETGRRLRLLTSQLLLAIRKEKNFQRQITRNEVSVGGQSPSTSRMSEGSGVKRPREDANSRSPSPSPLRRRPVSRSPSPPPVKYRPNSISQSPSSHRFSKNSNGQGFSRERRGTSPQRYSHPTPDRDHRDYRSGSRESYSVRVKNRSRENSQGTHRTRSPFKREGNYREYSPPRGTSSGYRGHSSPPRGTSSGYRGHSSPLVGTSSGYRGHSSPQRRSYKDDPSSPTRSPKRYSKY